jgi:integrase/recombinase XerD
MSQAWVDASDVRVAEIVEPYVRARVRQGQIVPLTARNQRGVLHHFARSADCDVDRLSERHVRRWLEHNEHLAASTRRNHLAIVRTFCTWLHDEAFCPRNACRKITPLREPRRVPRALTAEQVARILDACPDSRARVAVVLMVQLGLRRGEVARLEIGDFDFTNRLVIVRGKGGHQRMLYVTEQAASEVLRHLSIQGSVAGPLLRSQQYPQRGLHPDTVSAIVRRAMEASGVKQRPRDGVSPHALRHSALTDMLRHGAPIRDVQAVAGHQHSQTTEVYLPLMVGTLRDAMAGRWYGDAS